MDTNKVYELVQRLTKPPIGTSLYIQFFSEHKRDVLKAKVLGVVQDVGYIVQADGHDGDNVMTVPFSSIKRIIWPGAKEELV